jgi:hypothetical protein
MQTIVTVKENPPTAREGHKVGSVFPSNFLIKFSAWGDTFEGAYQDGPKTAVYAAKGIVEATPPGILHHLAAASGPVEDIFGFLHQVHGDSGSSPTSVTPLLNYTVMVPDPSKPGSYKDEVAEDAMADFYKIIQFYMDKDLSETFVSKTPVVLLPDVEHIAKDDVAKNSAFYQSLQVPYIVSLLSQSAVIDEAKNCNGRRASKLLQSIPADSPVYQRQINKLYNFRFLQRNSGMSDYLNDQQQNRDKYKPKIRLIADTIIKNLATEAASVKDTNPEGSDAALDKAKAEIEDLFKWADSNNLYWAFALYYFIRKSQIPNWYDQYTQGSMDSDVGMKLKYMNSIFGMLEGGQINPGKGLQNFMQAFNNLLRDFQMMSIIPTLIDPNGLVTDMDTILKDCLEQFYEKYKDSQSDPLNQAAADAKFLHEQDLVRAKMFEAFIKASRVGGAIRSWNLTMTMWQQICSDSDWFKKLAKGTRFLGTMAMVVSGVFAMMPLFDKSYDKMTPGEKAGWAL